MERKTDRIMKCALDLVCEMDPTVFIQSGHFECSL
jgi:hypothetical protein